MISFDLFEDNNLHLPKKTGEALINIFLFQRLGCLSSHFQEITHTSERKRPVLTHHHQEILHKERESMERGDEESIRETSSSIERQTRRNEHTEKYKRGPSYIARAWACDGTLSPRKNRGSCNLSLEDFSLTETRRKLLSHDASFDRLEHAPDLT